MPGGVRAVNHHDYITSCRVSIGQLDGRLHLSCGLGAFLAAGAAIDGADGLFETDRDMPSVQLDHGGIGMCGDGDGCELTVAKAQQSANQRAKSTAIAATVPRV